MAARAANTVNKSTHLTVKKKKTKSHTKDTILFGKWRFREKEVRRMGQKQNETRQKERPGWADEQVMRYIDKCDQTDSPEIPDRGETS